MSAPARFLSGVATGPSTTISGTIPFPDPHYSQLTQGLPVSHYETDFYSIDSGWTVTGTSSTFTLTAGVGGFAVLTPGSSGTASAAYRTAAAYQLVSGQKFWFRARIALSDSTGTTANIGLTAAAGATTDGLYFHMAAAGALSLVSVVGSTSTTLLTGLETLSNGVYTTLAFYYDGKSLAVYLEENLVARVTSPTLTTAILTPWFQMAPGTTETLTVDNLFIAQEIPANSPGFGD